MPTWSFVNSPVTHNHGIASPPSVSLMADMVDSVCPEQSRTKGCKTEMSRDQEIVGGFRIKIWRTLFQKVLSAIPKRNGFQMSIPSSEIVFSERALHKYLNILVYAHI